MNAPFKDTDVRWRAKTSEGEYAVVRAPAAGLGFLVYCRTAAAWYIGYGPEYKAVIALLLAEREGLIDANHRRELKICELFAEKVDAEAQRDALEAALEKKEGSII